MYAAVSTISPVRAAELKSYISGYILYSDPMRSREQLRREVMCIFNAALDAADPGRAVSAHVRLNGDVLEVDDRLFPLENYRRVYVFGAGKASAKMAGALTEIMGGRLCGGLVIVKYGYALRAGKVTVVEAGHPIPDENGVRASEDLIHVLRATSREDLVVGLISGGGSALLTAPAESLSLKDKQEATEALLKSGASIHEINPIRKHMSRVKGGRLAEIAYPSTMISLILSDVVGDSLETIASGPTAPDPTTFADCVRILDRYGLRDRITAAVSALIESGVRGQIAETPKPGDPVFDNVANIIVGNNRLALRAAKNAAETLGYDVTVLDEFAEGEAAAIAVRHAEIAKRMMQFGDRAARPVCIISGGEATVTVRGDGVGGRNQEFALAMALEISGIEGIVALSGGTDGTDGPTDAAGAIVDGATVERGLNGGVDAQACLARNDSYGFLRQTGDLLITGPTFTNVMDVRLLLIA